MVECCDWVVGSGLGNPGKLFLFSVSFTNLVIYSSVLSHPCGTVINMKEIAVNGQVTNVVRLLAPTLSVGEATVEQFQERVQVHYPRSRTRLAGIRAEAVAELRRREGTELTETVLREDGLRSRRRARSEVETAVELSGIAGDF